MPTRYWVLILTLGFCWGGAFLLNAVLLRDLGPLTVSMGRVGFGAAGCWVWALATGRRMRRPLPDIGGLFLLGVVFFAVPFALYPISQQHLPSGVAGIVNAMTPVMVVIVSHVWPGGEKADLSKVLGVATGFAGIVVLSLPYLGAGHATELWAIAVALCAPVCYGIATNHARRFTGLDSTVIAAWSLTGATLFIAPLALTVEGMPQVDRVETWGALFVIGVILTSVGFTLLYWLLPRAGATAASTVTFVAPMSAVLLGAHFLNETVLPLHMAGMATIFAGLVLIDGRLVRMLALRAATVSQPKG